MLSFIRLLQCAFLYSLWAMGASQNNNTEEIDFFVFIKNTDDVHNDDYHHEMWHRFAEFRRIFDKNYDSFRELELRYHIFRANMIDIVTHNAKTTSKFKLAMNHFTDLANDELRVLNHLRGFAGLRSRHCSNFETSVTNDELPDAVDWRAMGAVTEVKDQGQCGSCWTFSATGAIEGAWAISEQDLVDLSEQELVDCATGVKYGSHGCNGGQMDGAFGFVMENGQCTSMAYPYVSGDTKTESTCMDSCNAYAKISGCYDVEPNNQVSLKTAVSMQPVAIAIEADSFYFQSYSSGILDSTKCGTQLDHGVLIVGYGEENGDLYWIVKNSWSDSWGDEGYVKIARSESENDPGICGIAMQPSFPVV